MRLPSSLHGHGRGRSRRGFTLIELLVVISIIALLIALILPAVQAAREAARRTQCQNNLKQLALAAANFESTYRTLPPGLLWQDESGRAEYQGSEHQHLGTLAYLLPFLEQPAIYDAMDSDMNPRRGGLPFWATPGGGSWIMAQARIPAFRCPSDNDVDPEKGCIVGVRGVSSGAITGYSTMISFGPPYAAALGRTNYLGNPGGFGRIGNAWDEWCGPLQVRLESDHSDITDGASNTILLGESAGGYNADGVLEYTHSWIGSGILPSAYGLGYAGLPAWYEYGSHHEGDVAQFALVDGSVRVFPRNIDQWGVFMRLCGMRDGRTVSTGF
jgi:prepilin-type N-terminal cleavage/methylation domain-containing protein